MLKKKNEKEKLLKKVVKGTTYIKLKKKKTEK